VKNVIQCCLALDYYRLMSRITTTGAPRTQREASLGTRRLSASMGVRSWSHRSIDLHRVVEKEITRSSATESKSDETSERAQRRSELQKDSIEQGGMVASVGGDALSSTSVCDQDGFQIRPRHLALGFCDDRSLAVGVTGRGLGRMGRRVGLPISTRAL
jgi:hypothetical protein